jgi:hypothetical protein|nr:MAG TPA: hypothetical protein [Caudoviricetes sp.]
MANVNVGIRKVSFIDPNDGETTYGILSDFNIAGRILRSAADRDQVFAEIEAGLDDLEYVEDYSDHPEALVAWVAMLNQNQFGHEVQDEQPDS